MRQHNVATFMRSGDKFLSYTVAAINKPDLSAYCERFGNAVLQRCGALLQQGRINGAACNGLAYLATIGLVSLGSVYLRAIERYSEP